MSVARLEHGTVKGYKKAAQADIRNEIALMKIEKRSARRYSSAWHRADAAIQALLWVKQTVLR